MNTEQLLKRLAEMGVSRTAIAKALDLDKSRVTEMYNRLDDPNGRGTRRLLHDEAVCLIEKFGVTDPASSAPEPISPPLAKLLALHAAEEFGVSLSDPRVDNLAVAFQSLSKAVANPLIVAELKKGF